MYIYINMYYICKYIIYYVYIYYVHELNANSIITKIKLLEHYFVLRFFNYYHFVIVQNNYFVFM